MTLHMLQWSKNILSILYSMILRNQELVSPQYAEVKKQRNNKVRMQKQVTILFKLWFLDWQTQKVLIRT